MELPFEICHLEWQKGGSGNLSMAIGLPVEYAMM